MSALIGNVSPTSETKTISVPFPPGMAGEVKKHTEDCMSRFCELVAHQFSLDIDELRGCIPTELKYIEREPVSRGKKVSTIDWEMAQTKKELAAMTLVSLKDILASKSLRISGSKGDLVDRVWGILHPDEAPDDGKPKKRGRKAGSKNKSVSTVVDDSDSDVPCGIQINTTPPGNSAEDIMALLEAGVEMTLSDGKSYTFVSAKKWLFEKDDDGDLEWAGYLGDGQTLDEKDPPRELIDLYSS